MRTTIDIDDLVLKELKQLQKRDGRSLGRLVSDLLVQSLSARRAAPTKAPAFHWVSASMGARVDLDDKDAVRDAIDGNRR